MKLILAIGTGSFFGGILRYLLSQVCYQSYCVNQERKTQLAKLLRTNEQLEFMLREKLIS